jgi:Domain of unknown function (DUF4395)
VIDSNLPRFSQAVQAVALLTAFALQVPYVVPGLAAVLLTASVAGPRWNLLAYLYRALPIRAGEPEAAGPPRFAQALGGVFLGIGSMGLFALPANTAAWWAVGWGASLAVALLAALAAATSF